MLIWNWDCPDFWIFFERRLTPDHTWSRWILNLQSSKRFTARRTSFQCAPGELVPAPWKATSLSNINFGAFADESTKLRHVEVKSLMWNTMRHDETTFTSLSWSWFSKKDLSRYWFESFGRFAETLRYTEAPEVALSVVVPAYNEDRTLNMINEIIEIHVQCDKRGCSWK